MRSERWRCTKNVEKHFKRDKCLGNTKGSVAKNSQIHKFQVKINPFQIKLDALQRKSDAFLKNLKTAWTFTIPQRRSLVNREN